MITATYRNYTFQNEPIIYADGPNYLVFTNKRLLCDLKPSTFPDVKFRNNRNPYWETNIEYIYDMNTSMNLNFFCNLEHLESVTSEDEIEIDYRKYINFRFNKLETKVGNVFDCYKSKIVSDSYKYFSWLLIPSQCYAIVCDYDKYKIFPDSDTMTSEGLTTIGGLMSDIFRYLHSLKMIALINEPLLYNIRTDYSNLILFLDLMKLSKPMIVIGTLFIAYQLTHGAIKWLWRILINFIVFIPKIGIFAWLSKINHRKFYANDEKVTYTLQFSQYTTVDASGQVSECHNPIKVKAWYYKNENKHIEELLLFLKDRVSPSASEQIQRELDKIDWYVKRTPNIDERLKSF